MTIDFFYNTLNDGIYSIMDLEMSFQQITPAILLNNEKFESKYTPIFLDSQYGNEIKHKDAIFKHSNGYYIYLTRQGGDLSNFFKIKVIYKTEQYEEIKIYINALKKIENGNYSDRVKKIN